MKNPLLLGLFTSAALALGAGFGQAPQAQTPSQDIAELKRQVARLSAKLDALEQATAAARAQDQQLEQVVAYIEAQAKAAAGLQKVLVESEQKGFTFGINPESREVLLAGFDHFATTLQAGVPGQEQEQP